MNKSVTFLAIIIQLANIIDTFGPCTPNTHFVINGFICFCDNRGLWNEANCNIIGRRSSCRPGEIVKRGCTECVCQKNFIFRCNNKRCISRISKLPMLQKLSQYGPRCTPFRSYYINCTLCVCPASGQTSEALCAVDVSCPLLENPVESLRFGKQNYCFPNVMYLFPCLQCLCSETGTFSLDKCIEKCYTSPTKAIRRCIPGKLYRSGCNICKCPENSISDDKLCEYTKCNNETLTPHKQSIHYTKTSCTPHVFSKPRCLFCDCKPDGIIDEHSCFELDCSKALKFQYDHSRMICSPGELVSLCVECFCLRDGSENPKYCTRRCSNQDKLEVLEKILNKNRASTTLLDENKINKVKGNDKCVPGSLYIDEGRYCLCPESALTEFKYCTNFYQYLEKSTTRQVSHVISQVQINFDGDCKPSTLVEFDCNICFCSKYGKIDPKWCTYDDCESKKTIQESHKVQQGPMTSENSNDTSTCKPGSIATVKCNFCICPDSGIQKERVCTKNECIKSELEINYDKFTCEPLAYYEVDCNICYCPSDGLKNVAMCTKNPCETIFLRSLDSCVPGHLFTDDCNMCICPLNGNKKDRACTNHDCGMKTWNLFHTPAIFGNEDGMKRSVDVCFRGEEFVDGCKICVCPEVELKAYAHCEAVLCDEDTARTNVTAKKERDVNHNKLEKRDVRRSNQEFDDDNCLRVKLNSEPERADCTAGSMYIIRCRQCICPYIGNINNFCRPLPKSVYCEQAYPGYNYVPMGRRDTPNATLLPTNYEQKNNQHQNHTRYSCKDVGRIMDRCFICECDGEWLIREHCFQSDAKDCQNATPSFIVNDTLIKL